jgi:hypothetical protein
MDFRPVNSDHAVQSAAFSVLFDGAIPAPAIQSLRSRKDLTAELPAIQTPEAFEFNVGGGTPQVPQRLGGIQFSHLRPDGTPAWALRMVGNDLTVECTRYTRWERVWETTRKYLNAGLGVAQPSKRKVALIAHAVVDVFVANREDYDLTSLLRQSPLLAERVFSSGPTWHNHIGWFSEPMIDGPKAVWLNQLNVDAVRIPPDNQLVIQITHNQELRFAPAVEMSEMLPHLDRWFSDLHLANKRVLSDVLNSSVAKQIGLDA